MADNDTVLTLVLHHLFNSILLSGKVPKQLKIDRRQPIFKKGGDKTCVSDYRLLAIHSVFRKVLCTILNNRIRSVINLDDSQNGFRKNRRGTDNILILNNLMKQNNIKSGAYCT